MSPSRLVMIAAFVLFSATPLIAAPADAAAAPPDRCSIPHYPIAVGNVSEYRITSRQLDAKGKVVEESVDTYTEEIVAVDADGYRVKMVSDGNSYELAWACSDEGITMKYDEQPETSFTTTGVLVPATLAVGDSWSQSSTVKTSEYTQTTKTVNRVPKREMVKTPVGEFEAWRVEYEVSTTAEGREPRTTGGTTWYATGVGSVKSISVLPVEMEKTRQVETTIELVRQSTK